MDEKGRYLVRKGKRKPVKGTWTADSLYYLWFEYLKRSDKYKRACQYNGKGMQKIYDDFGDIFQYEGLDGFWAWWTERGQFLFGVPPATQVRDFLSVEQIVEMRSEIETGKYQLVALPTNLSKATLRRRINKLISGMRIEADAVARAKYEVKQVKVDSDSLKSCLLAYDLRTQNLDILEIAFRVKSVLPKEADDLRRDGRALGKEADLKKLAELSEKRHAKYQQVLARAERKVNRRLEREGKSKDAVDYDALLDKEMGLLKTNYIRTGRKRSLRTNTYKLLNKAEANIAAVERGEFGIGH